MTSPCWKMTCWVDALPRAAGLQFLCGVLVIVDETLLDGDDHLFFHLAAQLHGHQGGGIVIDGLVDRGHDAEFDQLFDDLGGRFLHAAGQLADGDLVGNLDHQRRLLGNFQLEAAHFFLLLIAALVAEVAALLIIAALLVADALLSALGVLQALGYQGFDPGPVTPWGKPAMGLKTRKKKNPTNKFIVKRRNAK